MAQPHDPRCTEPMELFDFFQAGGSRQTHNKPADFLLTVVFFQLLPTKINMKCGEEKHSPVKPLDSWKGRMRWWQ